MKGPVLVIIKPDGIKRNLVGNIFTKFAKARLEIVAIRMSKVTRKLAEEHYKQIKGQPFFKKTVSYFCGEYRKTKNLLFIIYYGEDSIKKCRRIAGATNPQEAAPNSIRGAYGRISARGIYQNVVHVSSDEAESQREIKLWFDPADITRKLYPTKIKTINTIKKKVWL